MTVAPYTLDLHNHRFAAWAAGRAASTSTWRFTVEAGRKLLESCGFTPDMAAPDTLPDATRTDGAHTDWRAAMKAATAVMYPSAPVLTDGIAAKLINVYLKARFVCGGFANHPNVVGLHPPIDSLLLKELALKDFAGRAREWRTAYRVGWSNFDGQQYQSVVDSIRGGLNGQPMWMIEKFWKGHR
jgi:hypothetical protein